MTKKNLQAAYIYMMAVTRQEAHVLPPLLAQPAGRPTPHSHFDGVPMAASCRHSHVSFCFLLLLLLNGAHHVEARRHRERRKDYMLLVFGDSFADAGNTLKGPLGLNTRGWYEPCGVSDARHGNKPTGRCSDGMVQSDFLGT